MKLDDRVWLLLNKKPPKGLVAYLNLVLPWLLIGAFFLLGALLSVVTWLGWLLILSSLVLAVGNSLWDKWTGYLDAIHQHNFKRWTEKRVRLQNGSK